MQLGPLEMLLLKALREAGPARPSRLLRKLEAQGAGMAYTTLTNTLYRLEDKGLVVSRPQGLHGRVFFVDEQASPYREQARSMWERLVLTFGPDFVSHVGEGSTQLSAADIEALIGKLEELKQGGTDLE